MNMTYPVVVAGVMTLLAAPQAFGQTAEQVLKDTGVKAGVVAVVGCTDGQLETDLAGAGPFVVHGLAANPADRDRVRAALTKAGHYGVASVEFLPAFTPLPYPDRFVSVLVTDLDALGPKAPPAAEMERVVIPNGYLYLKKGGAWGKKQVAGPAGLDGWTHFRYDVTATDASHDMVCAPPNTLKWITGVSDPVGPGAGGSPTAHNTESGFRADNGKVAYNATHLHKPGEKGIDWQGRYLIARDAYNGVPTMFIKKTNKNDAIGALRYATVLKGDHLFTSTKAGEYIAMFDVTNGQLVRTFDQGLKTKWWDESLTCLVYKNRLYQVQDDTIVILDIKTGDVIKKVTRDKTKFHFPIIAEKENALYVVTYEGLSTWRFPTVGQVKNLLRLDVDTLEEKWRVDPPYVNITRLAYYENKKLLLGANVGRGDAQGGAGPSKDAQPAVFAVDAGTGKLVWKREGKDIPRGQKPDPKTGWGGVFMNMVVWNDQLWADFTVLDPLTGTMINEEAYTPGYNARCVPPRAAGNFLNLGFTEYFSRLEKDENGNLKRYMNYATRASCSMPALPAYGQYYFSPTACSCVQNKLEGFLSLGVTTPATAIPDTQRLETGEAYGRGATTTGTAATPARVAKNQALYDDMATTNFPYDRDAASTPLTVGEVTFTAAVREHRIDATKDGTVVWSFATGGRIAPTLVYLNSRIYAAGLDGYVYCLDAATGKLHWRFLAAPAQRRMYAYGQLESAWPVYGVVTYPQAGNDQLAFCAGRSAELDGGLMIYSLDAATGQMKWKVPAVITNARVKDGVNVQTSNSIENAAMTFENGKLHMNRLEIDPGKPEGCVVTKSSIVKTPRKK